MGSCYGCSDREGVIVVFIGCVYCCCFGIDDLEDWVDETDCKEGQKSYVKDYWCGVLV